jgi:aldehyde:ferredoxin oxidoreductase
LDIDKAELWKIARRNRNLIRAINTRRGMRRKDETIPEDHYRKRFPEYETKLLDEYYEYKGWNSEGIPTKASLQELALDFVSDDLIERGILTEDEETPSKETPVEKEKA